MATDDSMSDDVFEEPPAVLNIDQDEIMLRTPSPSGYPGYRPPVEALRLYALQADINEESTKIQDGDDDGWKSYKLEDENPFDENLLHKVE